MDPTAENGPPHRSHDRPNSAARSTLSTLILTAAVLSWLGAVICFLLLQKHTGLRGLLCPAQAGCEAVLASRYSALFGIPLSWFGVALYLTTLALSLSASATRSPPVRLWLLNAAVWLIVVGASFSGLLMVVQFAVLHAFCILCTASAVVMGALLFTALRAERRAAAESFVGSRPEAVALATVALISSIVLASNAIVASDETVAVVDGQRFTRTQMEADIGAQLHPLHRAIHLLETEWLRKKVDDALLSAEAARQHIGVEELLAAAANSEARISLLNEIAKSHRVQVLLAPPKVRVLNIDLATAQTSGPRDAKVQLVVFSDFQCEFCSRLAPVLQRVREDFPRDVLVGYRYFPLETHPRSYPAAIAAQCAAEQGAFWQYHDKLFAEGGDLGDAKLLSIATALGLDQKRFQECRNSDMPRKIVEASHKDAVECGLEGAPALFLDGRLIGGVVDYKILARKIRERLQAARGN